VGRNLIALLGAVVLCGFLSAAALAQVVALGASNTVGMGVRPQEAYPAQLEAMLRAKGYNGRVVNAGISGDMTAGMLARLDSAVPNGTRVVILQPGGNDLGRAMRRRGGGGPEARAENIDQIVSRLRSRGIQVIMLENQMLGAVPAQYHQPDGQHLTPEGYRLLASWLLPQVAPALGLPAS
jgi:acyl-CoA thioesterase-1